MLALTNTGGTFTALVPDVCKTPSPGGPVPVPYPNIAQGVMVNPSTASSKVVVSMGQALTLSSKTLISNGDEAGTAGGVASGSFIGEVAFTKGSDKVRIEGKAAVRQADPTTHNKQNTTGMAAAPSQSKVMMS